MRRPGPLYFEPSPADSFDAVHLVSACVESGARGILLDDRVLPPEFFDLSTGLVGEILHKLTMYHIRLAGVVPDVSIHSPSFRAFLREANSGSQIRFHSTREQAVAWLESRSVR